jgi:hypothetical protein
LDDDESIASDRYPRDDRYVASPRGPRIGADDDLERGDGGIPIPAGMYGSARFDFERSNTGSSLPSSGRDGSIPCDRASEREGTGDSRFEFSRSPPGHHGRSVASRSAHAGRDFNREFTNESTTSEI